MVSAYCSIFCRSSYRRSFDAPNGVAYFQSYFNGYRNYTVSFNYNYDDRIRGNVSLSIISSHRIVSDNWDLTHIDLKEWCQSEREP